MFKLSSVISARSRKNFNRLAIWGVNLTRVAFISFHLKALDGVSAEAEKRIEILSEWGFEVHRVAGYIPDPGASDHVISRLNDRDPEIEMFNARLFQKQRNNDEVLAELRRLVTAIGESLTVVLDQISPDLCVCENVFTLPLNIPFTMALCGCLEGRRLPCVAVHHGPTWEHPGYGQCVNENIVGGYFPASLTRIRHVATSEWGRRELLRRTGLAASLLPDCQDFNQTREIDDFNVSLRRDLRIPEDETMILEPAGHGADDFRRQFRFAAEYARASGVRVWLVTTGSQGAHEREAVDVSARTNDPPVEVVSIPGWVGGRRRDPSARSAYDLHDLYAHCDLVILPANGEVLGDPVLESAMHRKPLLVSDHPALEELRAFGFQFLNMDPDAVECSWRLMEHPQLLEEMLGRNYDLGRKHFSLEEMRRRLTDILEATLVRD